MSLISRPLVRATKPLQFVGQLGGHVKSGIDTPVGERTGNRMALISAIPLAPGSDKMVLTFLDRSSPVDSFDNKPCAGDNAVVIAPIAEVNLSIIKGVCPGDWRGVKINFGDEISEPVDLDVDPTGLDLAASDAWVDMVDELGSDCSKIGGYPLWQNAPLDVDGAYGEQLTFHSRLTGDLIDFGLGDGGVIYTFVDGKGEGGCVCWQEAGGGAETTYHHYQ